MNSPFLTGIVIGALAGGICFVVFGLMSAVLRGGLSVVFILQKFSGKPVKVTPLVRMIVVAGIILSIFFGMAVSMLLGGAAGGVIGYLLMKMT